MPKSRQSYNAGLRNVSFAAVALFGGCIAYLFNAEAATSKPTAAEPQTTTVTADTTATPAVKR